MAISSIGTSKIITLEGIASTPENCLFQEAFVKSKLPMWLLSKWKGNGRLFLLNKNPQSNENEIKIP